MTISHNDIPPDKIARIVARWREGWSIARIASTVKRIPCDVIRAICAETGYRTEDLVLKPRGPSRKWTRQELAALRQMLADGVTYAKIAQHLRRSPDAVREKAEDMHAHEQCARQTTTHGPPRARPRKCLKCQQMFDSDGPHNRICDACKTHEAYRGFAIYAAGVGRR